MKRIHIVNPYGSTAMTRMILPLTLIMPALYVVSEGQAPDESADLNFHMPYHTMTGWERTGNSKHVIAYTHCNPPDVPRLMDACARADAIICMSFQGRRELIERGVDPLKLHVIYSAADQFKFRKRNIGIIGFVQPNGRKREGLLVDLAWQYDLSPFHFLIVGTGWGATVNTLRSMGVSVEWIEFADDEAMRKVYNSIDALLVTGYVEGGPLPLIEAMSAGVPVFSPSFGYAADLLGDENLYDTLDDLTALLDDFVKERVFYHGVVQSWTWQDYAAEHALVFGRLLDDAVDLYPERAMSRYSQLLDVIDEHRPRSVVEIGTWKGNRAIQMIQQAAKYHPMDKVSYQGFDLFKKQTGEHLRRELSKVGWPLDVVRRRIEATGADVRLVEGDTHETGRMIAPADLYFIDGGHSEETIENDWRNVRERMKPDSVVVFDDYYYTGAPDGTGCKALIDGLDRAVWEVMFLPVITLTADGRQIGMVKVRRQDAAVYLQMQEQTHDGSGTRDAGEFFGSVSSSWVQGTDVARPADTNGKLEWPTAAP